MAEAGVITVDTGEVWCGGWGKKPPSLICDYGWWEVNWYTTYGLFAACAHNSKEGNDHSAVCIEHVL